jgi:hypothetical protein
LHYF